MFAARQADLVRLPWPDEFASRRRASAFIWNISMGDSPDPAADTAQAMANGLPLRSAQASAAEGPAVSMRGTK